MTQEHAPTVPDWTLGWRLRRALDFAGVSVAAMADELGVGRTTVSGWLNDPDRRPRRVYLRYWADRCRVPLDWLQYGELPRVDSNHQPAGWQHDLENVPNGRRLTRPEILALRRHFDPANGRRVIVRADDRGSADLPIAGAR